MRLAAIDIGSNSVRLLIGDEGGDVHRQAFVTGLGKGVAASGLLSEAAIRQTLDVLADFADTISEASAERVDAVATAAVRIARNSDAFLDQAEGVLGFRPRVIPGTTEAALSFRGATADLSPRRWMVVDIGGASTEFISEAAMGSSFDIGSVRLTDLYLEDRPVAAWVVGSARSHALEIMAPVGSTRLPVVGVAGTWTSVAGLLDGTEDPGRIHHRRVSFAELELLIGKLATLTVAETAVLAGLDPARAPVILGGVIVAAASLETLGAESALVSVHDLLDGVLAELRQHD